MEMLRLLGEASLERISLEGSVPIDVASNERPTQHRSKPWWPYSNYVSAMVVHK